MKRLVVATALVSAALGLGVAAFFIVGETSGGDKVDRSAALADFSAAYPASIVASGEVREFGLVAEPTRATLAEGLEVEVWAYNGTVPGPELRIELGDTVVVNLDNRLPQATSIHWHGVRVPNAMDGVPGVNQDAIEPGDSFRYEFVPKDPGTFWFHSHNRGSEQIERGLYGSLVVVDPDEPVYDQDLVWMIDDWTLNSDGSLYESFNDMHDITHNGRWGNVVTANGTMSPTVTARPGEQIRLRMVNASNARVIAPEFDGAAPIGIAVDGMLARAPFDGDGFVLAPGNRIDIEFEMPDLPVSVFDNFNGEGFEIGIFEPAGAPITSIDRTVASPANTAVPDPAALSSTEIDHEYSLDFLSSMMSPEWSFNGRSYAETETFTVRSDELHTFRLKNDSQALHPIHFHGQFFMVTAVDGEPIDEGHFRDTVLVYPNQTIDIAMRATDKGLWAVHCHIQEHAEAGMMTLLEVQ